MPPSILLKVILTMASCASIIFGFSFSVKPNFLCCIYINAFTLLYKYYYSYLIKLRNYKKLFNHARKSTESFSSFDLSIIIKTIFFDKYKHTSVYKNIKYILVFK